MSVGELRSFCQVPADIIIEFSDGAAVSTVGGADNAVYFTREQFVAGLRFPISLLVKQFFALYPGSACTHRFEHLLDF